jgi:hypothetical protein
MGAIVERESVRRQQTAMPVEHESASGTSRRR